MSNVLFKNISLVNEGAIIEGDLLVKDGRIERIDPQIQVDHRVEEIDGEGLHLLPGVIDDQVHFREPGLTHKANIHSESAAAAAGGVTSFMEMPNTSPPALTKELLEDKYDIGARTAYTNYSFFMGVSNENLDEVLRVDPKNVCGIKVFMGSSTGNMLVDKEEALNGIFANAHMLVATHCEDEQTIKDNQAAYIAEHGEPTDASAHPVIRNEDACYISSSKAVELAKKHDTRLHILHLTTAIELDLFTNEIPLEEKRITSEVCVHHLWFDAKHYETLGNQIKCNPAIKSGYRDALFEAMLDDRLDIIATDHAPHTLEEKEQPYSKAPAGLPLIQFALPMMLTFHDHGKISLDKIVEKMSHSPAKCFNISERGYLREGYHADLTMVDTRASFTIDRNDLLYKCGWSPMEGETLTGKVLRTMVGGYTVYNDGQIFEAGRGQRLQFDR